MSSIQSAFFKPNLRVFFRLDQDKLSPEFIDKIGFEEGSTEYVNADTSRDLGWTEEILEARIGAALVDENGDIVAEWAGDTAFIKADKARSTAKITFSVDVDTDDADSADDEPTTPAPFVFEPA